jgi:hypothetical protein
MKSVMTGLIGLVFASSAWAISFQADKNHCKAGEYKPVNPLSGGQGGLLDATAWAETGWCMKMQIENLTGASNNLNVLTWKGITRIAGNKNLPIKGADELFDTVITYEAYHKHLWCQSAQWPLEWKATLEHGTSAAPDHLLIHVERVPGGDSNGAYVKQMSALIEFTRYSTGETNFHMRYEVEAPSQDPTGAVEAITQYADRLNEVAAGKKAPGAAEDPECPYGH